jgi:ABC-type antimicrobial peptide transport system ATPase subunit
MYQKVLDHLQEFAEEKNATRATLKDHEDRICALEECETVEAAKDDLLYSVAKHPITLVLLGCLISFGSWIGYRLLCHMLGVRL